MARRHRFQERSARSGQQRVFRAQDLTTAQHGRLVTVQHHELVKSRGFLLQIRPATQDDLTARPGQLVIHLRARRDARVVGPEWKVTVDPDAAVIVHTETMYAPEGPAGGDAA
ncbi:hypothetical protein [Kocuria sp.]|uniref:hypothetical protein n=1 Tax=Kocuria sp. TaxID=1871328 RepID=UPI0026E0EC64|nr:hypothetical protein [Kocuria sp.]MDO5619292.1 hypothetical protein [Kocuria sp.]